MRTTGKDSLTGEEHARVMMGRREGQRRRSLLVRDGWLACKDVDLGISTGGNYTKGNNLGYPGG